MDKLIIVLEPGEERGFQASMPGVPQVTSQGIDLIEAIRNMADALEEHLHVLGEN